MLPTKYFTNWNKSWSTKTTKIDNHENIIIIFKLSNKLKLYINIKKSKRNYKNTQQNY